MKSTNCTEEFFVFYIRNIAFTNCRFLKPSKNLFFISLQTTHTPAQLATRTYFFMRRIEHELLPHLYLTSMLSQTHTRPFQKLTPNLISKSKLPKNLIYVWVYVYTNNCFHGKKKNERIQGQQKTYRQNISDISPILQISSQYFNNISVPNYNANNFVFF